jgi:ABC-type tungstate transport system, permease component
MEFITMIYHFKNMLFTTIFFSTMSTCSFSYAADNPKEVIIALTTSIEDSGLLDVIVPPFEQKTGYKVKKLSIGTGQALALAEKGEVDALLVCAPKAEQAVEKEGAVVNRKLIMHNEYQLVGPAKDPAHIHGLDSLDALKKISLAKSTFISRGDNSGTNKMEQSLWKSAGIEPKGGWYQEVGAGMADALRISDEKNGYTLTDSGTFTFLKKTLSLDVMTRHENRLLNLFHAMQTNPQKFNRVNAAAGKAFVDFLLSPQGQKLIADHGIKEFGKPLFVIDGGKSEKDYGL